MDFMERLTEQVNKIEDLPIACKMGYLGANESFVIYPLPNSNVVQEFMNGDTDQQLNYEFAMKSRSQSKINQTLWIVQNELERLEELNSKDDSFEFQEVRITNKPFINQIDDQGWFVFLLNVQAKITIFKEEK